MSPSSSSLSSLSLLPPSRPTRLASFVPNMSFTTNMMIINTGRRRTRRRRRLISICASQRDSSSSGHHYDGKLVDESIIVLRMRIREMLIKEMKKAKELNEINGGGGWMEWERRYSEESYGSDVCEAVGFLQTVLMATRPCLALGILVSVFMSVSVSMSLSVFHLVGLAKEIFMSIHV